MDYQSYCINALINRFNLSWDVAYKAAWENEFDYMLSAEYLQAMLAANG